MIDDECRLAWCADAIAQGGNSPTGHKGAGIHTCMAPLGFSDPAHVHYGAHGIPRADDRLYWRTPDGETHYLALTKDEAKAERKRVAPTWPIPRPPSAEERIDELEAALEELKKRVK